MVRGRLVTVEMSTDSLKKKNLFQMILQENIQNLHYQGNIFKQLFFMR